MKELDKTSTQSPAALAKLKTQGKYKDAWDMLWKNEKSFWDLGQPHPYLERLLETAKEKTNIDLENTTVYIPGCGSGHEALTLSERGAVVIAADYTPKAIEIAKNLYDGLDNVEFTVEDALKTLPEQNEKFDIIIDRAMLCAIEKDKRQTYLDECANKLKQGGLFLSIAFTTVHLQHGPPHEIKNQEIINLTKDKYDLISSELIDAIAMTDYIKEELLVILRKK